MPNIRNQTTTGHPANVEYQRGDFEILRVFPEFKGKTKIYLYSVEPEVVIRFLKETFGEAGLKSKYKWSANWSSTEYFTFTIYVRDRKMLSYLLMLAE